MQRLVLPLGLGFGLALAAGGCSTQQIDNAGNAISSASPAFVNDALITAQIEGYFVTIDPDSALHVAISSNKGVVHLSGRVRSAQTLQRFVERAKTTPDVKSVESTLAVDPHLPSTKRKATDLALSVAVQAALAAQTGINALPVHVAARAGSVTLSGTVHSQAIRQTMLDTAKHTSGVRVVVDRLRVGS